MNRKNAKDEITNEIIEEGTEILLDFDKLQKIGNTGEKVLPVAVQDVESREILLIGYVKFAANPTPWI